MRKPFYHERFRFNVLRSEAFNRGPRTISSLFDSACSDGRPPLTASNQIRVLGSRQWVSENSSSKISYEYVFATLRRLCRDRPASDLEHRAIFGSEARGRRSASRCARVLRGTTYAIDRNAAARRAVGAHVEMLARCEPTIGFAFLRVPRGTGDPGSIASDWLGGGRRASSGSWSGRWAHDHPAERFRVPRGTTSQTGPTRAVVARGRDVQ